MRVGTGEMGKERWREVHKEVERMDKEGVYNNKGRGGQRVEKGRGMGILWGY